MCVDAYFRRDYFIIHPSRTFGFPIFPAFCLRFFHEKQQIPSSVLRWHPEPGNVIRRLPPTLHQFLNRIADMRIAGRSFEPMPSFAAGDLQPSRRTPPNAFLNGGPFHNMSPSSRHCWVDGQLIVDGEETSTSVMLLSAICSFFFGGPLYPPPSLPGSKCLPLCSWLLPA